MRRKKKQLRFTSAYKQKQKQTRAFIAAFAAFVLLLGTASTLLFMKSVDFDLHNVIRQDPTEPTSQAPVQLETVELRDASVLWFCCDSDNTLFLLAMVRADATEQNISVRAIDAQTRNANGDTLQSLFEKNGVAGLLQAVGAQENTKIDRYIKTTESNLKKTVSMLGDIPVEIPQAIQYRGDGYALFLDRGVQSLTGDLFVKYLRYADTAAQSTAAAAAIQRVLSSFSVTEPEAQFHKLVNLSDTDFSIIDVTDTNGLVRVYLALQDNIAVWNGENEKGDMWK